MEGFMLHFDKLSKLVNFWHLCKSLYYLVPIFKFLFFFLTPKEVETWLENCLNRFIQFKHVKLCSNEFTVWFSLVLLKRSRDTSLDVISSIFYCYIVHFYLKNSHLLVWRMGCIHVCAFLYACLVLFRCIEWKDRS